MWRPEVRHKPDQRFLLKAFLLLPLTFSAWHWAQVPVLNAFCGVADAVWPSLFPNGLAWVEGSGSADWIIHTGWPVLLDRTQKLTVRLDILKLARMVAGFPLLFALCLATPGLQWRRLAWGVGLLLSLCWMALTFYAWHTLAIASGTQPSFVDESMRPAPFALAIARYPAWQAYLSGYLMYLAILVIPFVAPLVLWAWLFRPFVRRLVIAARRSVSR